LCHLLRFLLGVDLFLGRHDVIAIQPDAVGDGTQDIGAALDAGDLAVDRIGGDLQEFQLPLALGLAGGLALGGLLGFVNGYAIVRSGVHSFIITLATMSIFFGGMVFMTHAQAFRGLPPELAAFGKAKLAGTLSPLLLVSIAVALALSYLYRLTGIGRQMLAAGANSVAAELSGVRLGRAIVLCHILSGVLAAIAAEMLAARHGAAIPSMAGQLGQDWLLPAFLAPVLGRTLLSGGRVSVLGTLLGAMLVSLLTNGLLLLRVGEFWVQACLGCLLLAAVLLDKLRRVVLARHRMA